MTRYVIEIEIDIDDEEFDPSEIHDQAIVVADELGHHFECELTDYERGQLVISQTRKEYAAKRKMLFVGRPEERD